MFSLSTVVLDCYEFSVNNNSMMMNTKPEDEIYNGSKTIANKEKQYL